MRRLATHRVPGSGPWPGPGAPLLVLALLWALLTPTGPAAAHGVELAVVPAKAACLKAGYSDGEIMSFAKVKVVGPDGRTFQVGNADKTGRFAFLPHKEGTYTIIVSDGMGHRAQIKVRLSPVAAKQTQPVTRPKGLAGQPLWARALWGLSFLCFLAGFLFWFKARGRGRG